MFILMFFRVFITVYYLFCYSCSTLPSFVLLVLYMVELITSYTYQFTTPIQQKDGKKPLLDLVLFIDLRRTSRSVLNLL